MASATSETKKELSQSTRYVPWEPYRAAAGRVQPGSNTGSGASAAKKPQAPLVGISVFPYKSAGPPVRKESRRSSKPNVFEETRLERVPSPSCDRASLAEADGADADQLTGVSQCHNNNNGLTTTGTAADDKAAHQQLTEMKARMEKLVTDKESVENELHVQKKVNEELKRLLVATMGEDLQEHVNSLSQDKVHLAKHITDCSEQQTVDQEKSQDLAINGDVWRSKYLAASVMIDELLAARVILLRHLTFEGASAVLPIVSLPIVAPLLTAGQRTIRDLVEECEYSKMHLLQGLAHLNCVKRTLYHHQDDVKMHSKNNNPPIPGTLFDLSATLHSLGDAIRVMVAPGTRPESASQSATTKQSSAEIDANKFLNVDIDQLTIASPCDEFKRLQQKRANVLGYPLACNFRNLTVTCCNKCADKEIKLV